MILFSRTRCALNPDIFLLSPHRAPCTWQRHQISRDRPLPSPAPQTDDVTALLCLLIKYIFRNHSLNIQRSSEKRDTVPQQRRWRRSNSASPGKLVLSTSVKNHLEHLAIISAFHRPRSRELADIQRESEILSRDEKSSANRKPPLSSEGLRSPGARAGR